jgi:hypothetical protein
MQHRNCMEQADISVSDADDRSKRCSLSDAAAARMGHSTPPTTSAVGTPNCSTRSDATTAPSPTVNATRLSKRANTRASTSSGASCCKPARNPFVRHVETLLPLAERRQERPRGTPSQINWMGPVSVAQCARAPRHQRRSKRQRYPCVPPGGRRNRRRRPARRWTRGQAHQRERAGRGWCIGRDRQV